MWASPSAALSFPKAIFSKSKLFFWLVLTRYTLRTEPPSLPRMPTKSLHQRFPDLTHLTYLTLLTFFLAGCATYKRSGLPPERAHAIEKQFHPPSLSPELEDKILALDPLHVSEKDIHEVLSQAPAPRIINIHGGIYPVHRRMISFSQFLIGMGYPAFSITNANDGTYTFSCYESSEMVAGMIAWYYEKESLRPIIVGHSQGGFQAVKILHEFAGHDSKTMAVWNPLTWSRENRYDIIDPLT